MSFIQGAISSTPQYPCNLTLTFPSGAKTTQCLLHARIHFFPIFLSNVDILGVVEWIACRPHLSDESAIMLRALS